MSKINNEIIGYINSTVKSQKSRAILKDFLNVASNVDSTIEFGLGYEKWKAIDIYSSGHRIGLIFLKSGLVKFFNCLPDRDKRSYDKGNINNRGEWVFEVEKLPNIQVMVKCLMDNLKAISKSSVKSNRQISPRTRFAVFVRDKYKCQYCGRSGPNVSLHIDHRTPVSLGGSNDISNLVTACSECNLGKSNLYIT